MCRSFARLEVQFHMRRPLRIIRLDRENSLFKELDELYGASNQRLIRVLERELDVRLLQRLLSSREKLFVVQSQTRQGPNQVRAAVDGMPVQRIGALDVLLDVSLFVICNAEPSSL